MANHSIPRPIAASQTALLNVDQAAAFLNLSPNTIRKYVLQRLIPFVKIGAAVRFEQSAIDQFIASHRVEGAKWQ